MIRMAAGMDDLFLRTVLQAGARGVVIEGSGAGHMPGNWKSALLALLDSGMPVVLTSRCGQGRVVPIYRGDLGGITLRDMGVIAAGDLSGIKARIALMNPPKGPTASLATGFAVKSTPYFVIGLGSP